MVENFYNLPKMCYSVNNITKQVILIKFGEVGYWDFSGCTYEIADERNKRLGVSHAQREAMQVGSMFGWNIPGIDPGLYKKANSLAKTYGE